MQSKCGEVADKLGCFRAVGQMRRRTLNGGKGENQPRRVALPGDVASRARVLSVCDPVFKSGLGV